MRAPLSKIVLFQEANGLFTFREALFDADGDLERLGVTPAFPRGLSVEDVREDLKEFIGAFNRTVIKEEDIEIEPDGMGDLGEAVH